MTANRRFRNKKSLGQNFMMDRNIARKLVESVGITKDDLILEVGPGTGILTEELLQRAKHVSSVEIDKRLVEILNERFASAKNYENIHHDFLTFDISGLSKRQKSKIKIIGNIPYHITSQILIHIFEHYRVVENLTATVQKEVAERILSPPGSKTYGILSVYAAIFSTPEKLFNISRGAFNPRPKVESTAFRLNFKEKISVKSEDVKLLMRVIRTSFGKRRKMLRNSLKDIGDCISYLEGKGFDLSRRPESLHIGEFIDLSAAIKEWINGEGTRLVKQ